MAEILNWLFEPQPITAMHVLLASMGSVVIADIIRGLIGNNKRGE